MEQCYLNALGVASALGLTVEETTRNLFAGSTAGMKRMTTILLDGEPTYFGFAPLTDEMLARTPSRLEALIDATLIDLEDALDDLKTRLAPERIGVVIGTSNAKLEDFSHGNGNLSMAFPALSIREKLGLKGPAWGVSTACSSSGKVLASARKLLLNGICDAVIVGGADAYTQIVVNGFHALESISTELTRPLSPARDGINLGEAAALFILSKEKTANSIALLGVGETSDAYHLTAPHPDGLGAEASMKAALDEAGLEPDQIDYINLHGTGTVYNDAMECAAIRRLFGTRVACSSTKVMTGHTLGAAGALEAAFCWITLLRNQGLPPHLVTDIDRELAPFVVPTLGNTLPARYVLSNSFAFGGSNASVLLGRID